MSDFQKEKAVDLMIDRLTKIAQLEPQILHFIDATTVEPNRNNLQQLLAKVELMQNHLSEVVPKEVIFVNETAWPIPDPIRSQKIGLLQHAIIEQIERIDKKIPTGFRYTNYNRLLSRKIQTVNNVLDSCVKYTDKI